LPKAKAKILVIDDDPLVLRSCERLLRRDYNVQMVTSGAEGASLLAEGAFDLALVDLKLPDVSGMDILDQGPDNFPDVPLIVITGYSSVKSAVEAVKRGAFDYVEKPFEPDELEAAVEKALRQRRLLKDYRELRNALGERARESRLIGESPEMKTVLGRISQVARTDSTVLITGESGTGKELVARAVHFDSGRKAARFMAVDCGAISPSLIASELFGHVKGAFTGAASDRPGLIQAAAGGSVFLDEISNLPTDLQATLLRVIETREARAVGASESYATDVRYIAATNRDLQELVQAGAFREDLFYRLNVFPIHVPPLRDRRRDIPAIARHFLATFAAKMHKRLDDFTAEALNALTEYDWPGNVRELSNVVEHLVILCDGTRVGQASVLKCLTASPGRTPVPETAEQLNEFKRKLRDRATSSVEKTFLTEALRRNDFNVTKAAAQTGMQRTNFQALLKKHGLRIRDLIRREP